MNLRRILGAYSFSILFLYVMHIFYRYSNKLKSYIFDKTQNIEVIIAYIVHLAIILGSCSYFNLLMVLKL